MLWTAIPLLSLAGLTSYQERVAPFTERPLAGVRTTCGSAEKDYIVEVNGGGLVLGDFDADGDHDLVVIDGSDLERVAAERAGLPPRLYTNGGAADFAPAGEAWEMAGGRWGMGGVAGDVDGDGDLDLVVTEWGPDRLFLNDGGVGFSESTARAGLRGERWGTSAALFDYDGDGFLDLAVVNYLAFDPGEINARAGGACRWKGHAVMCGPEGLTPVHDQLYHNAGDGTFVDVSQAARMRPRSAAFGLGVTTLDFDVDGDVDLYVTNDSTPNHLWENGGDSTFAEVGFRKGVALDENGKEQAGMGIAVNDLNGDGRPDVFVTNFSGESNALYLSGRNRWRERADVARLGGPSIRRLGWGTALEDFDLDTDLDLVVFNGHVYPQADAPGSDTSYAQPDYLYENDGGGRFVTRPLSTAAPAVSRAAAAADLNDDGWLDLVALDNGGAVRVLLNQGGAGLEEERHYLRVRLSARGANTQALGARVIVTVDGTEAVREVRTAGGFQSGVPAEVHFGLGGAQRVERLVVHWPSGRRSVLTDVAPDRVLVVEEPEASADGGGDR